MANRPSFWQGSQLWAGVIQLGLFLGVVGMLALGWHNLLANLQLRQLSLGWQFLQLPADFDIGETLIRYRSTDPVLTALGVGLLNSLRILGLGIVCATVLGTLIGIARLSDNWLVNRLMAVYVETLRNTPLLLQLVFWYFAVFVSAPSFADRVHLWREISFSQQGLLLPEVSLRLSLLPWLGCLGMGGWLSIWIWRRQSRRKVELNEPTNPWFMAIITLIFWVCVGWVLTREFPMNWVWPQVKADGTQVAGVFLTPEFCALLLGLTLYTAAFIAEIVRGGIAAVPRGQWQAARSLGLPYGLTLRLVVLPQALRVIIPSLTSQYLNLAKNSSLAIAVGYPDLYSVASTVANKTGHAVEIIAILMVTYLTISLVISLGMNYLNHRIQIVER